MVDEATNQEENEMKHREFLSLTNDEARREFVIKEFQSGNFSHVDHIDFFMKQVAKGEIILNNEAHKESLKSLILNGGENFGVSEYKSLKDSIKDRADSSIKESFHVASLATVSG